MRYNITITKLIGRSKTAFHIIFKAVYILISSFSDEIF